jgi:integrase
MSEQAAVDGAGRRRSPVTMPGYHKGRPARNKGMRYPADPPRPEEIIAVMRAAGAGSYGLRMRGLIVVLWRAGLRIGEALALGESDLEPSRGSHGRVVKAEAVLQEGPGFRRLGPTVRGARRLRI